MRALAAGMEGLYAVLDYSSRTVRMCPFPYSVTAGRREARRLRRSDPPLEAVVPIDSLPTIAINDQIAANHFLMRAVVAMIGEQEAQAAPYLTAFSALARVRFAYITALQAHNGLALNLTVIDATDYPSVFRLFSQPLDDQ